MKTADNLIAPAPCLSRENSPSRHKRPMLANETDTQMCDISENERTVMFLNLNFGCSQVIPRQ